MNISHYAKAIGQIIAAAMIILVSALSDGLISPVEFVNIAIAIVTAAGVYWVPNLEAGLAKYAKAITSMAGAALAALVLILGTGIGLGDVTLADWLTVALAALATLGIGIVPNASSVVDQFLPNVTINEYGGASPAALATTVAHGLRQTTRHSL